MLREDFQRPFVGKRQLWTPDQEQTPKASFTDSSNIASVRTSQRRAQSFQHILRKGNQPPPQGVNSPSPINRNLPSDRDDNYDIILQPETRPISQEQLVAEVKGIYAGLVMVEAKCIEVDNKQTTLAQADPGAQPKLDKEQWQALIALHRTLLHEHHDFFLASQHPSASPVLRRLISKYAMPVRMWRYGIYSFLELLRHCLPTSLDHMLAFIYLAYSMMALLYETVPAFEDTWIECPGDLGRCRVSHGLLFTNRDMEKFEPTINGFLGLLDNQIGRVTRKFTDGDYYIAVANSVAMLGFASKDSVLMQAICRFPKDEEHDPNILNGADLTTTTPPFQSLNDLRNILQRLGNPNVCPLIHVPPIFLYELCKNPTTMLPVYQLNTLREIIEFYEEHLGYIGQTKELSGDMHTAAHWLSETQSALQEVLNSLNSLPFSKT
jgi:hypothetical protein